MSGGGGWWSRITETVPALSGLLGELFETFRATLIRDMTADFGNPNTFEVSQRHREQIDHAVAMDKALLLFAHSQGNLFVSRAYDHALTRVGAESVRVVHVAPASPRWTGPHSLADLDIVINALRLVGHVLPITDPIPGPPERLLWPSDLSSKFDPLGHGLLETYLNRNFAPAARIRHYVEQALRELRPPGGNPADPYPPFVNNPWTGGARPVYQQYATDNSSHRVEEVRESHSNGGTWVYFVRPNASVGHWIGGWTPSQSPSLHGFLSGQNNVENHSVENRFSSQVSGPGVSGSHTCTSSTTISTVGEDTVIIQSQGNCTYNRFLIPNYRMGLGKGVPRELRNEIGSVAAGTERRLNTATWGHAGGLYLERFEDGQQIREVRFLNGERASGSTAVYRRNWMGGWYQESRTVTQDIDTVREERERYRYSATLANNQGAIDAWTAAHRAWMTNEMQRLEEWLKGEQAYNQRLASCTPSQPPPDEEECMEGPGGTCLLPS
ncbi:MAG: hypothetical protein C0453_06290 [Comamonadaceae bacterium]|nr:hypothetical protein [Comamonadaceae bacterium]